MVLKKAGFQVKGPQSQTEFTTGYMSTEETKTL